MQITLIALKLKLVIDYPRSKQFLYYDIPFAHIFMTFLVNFTQNDPNRISNVKLLIKTVSKTIIELPLIYSENQKLWVGTKEFFIYTLPTNLDVEYDCIAPLTIPSGIVDNVAEITNETIEQYETNLRLLGYKVNKIKNTFQSGTGELIHQIFLVKNETGLKEGSSNLSIYSITEKEIQQLKKKLRIYKII